LEPYQRGAARCTLFAKHAARLALRVLRARFSVRVLYQELPAERSYGGSDG